MPELPEVETVVNGISPKLKNCKILKTNYSKKNLRLPIDENELNACVNHNFNSIYRRAKYVICNLSNGQSLVFHLGMSGQLTIQNEREVKKHDHIVMQIEKDNEKSWLVFNDPRRFGLCIVEPTENLYSHKLFSNLGLEPLTEVNVENFTTLLKDKKTNIKNFLMNAKYIVGIGNIYASEALFLANIHPLRKCCDLTKKEVEKLLQGIIKTLQEAIIAGGSTLKDYVNSNGETGYFQHKFKVYNKAGKPCEICGDAIEKIVISNRSTYYCTQCQL